MKKNNGFALLETLIVSTFVIGTLVFLYTQFSNIKKNYEVSFKYNTINGLYATNNISKYLSKIDITNIETHLLTNDYMEIENCNFTTSYQDYCTKLMDKLNIKKAIVVNDKISDLKKNLKDTNLFSEGLYQFILNINSKDSEFYRIIIEYNDSTYSTIRM